eukprot:256593_1
MTDLDIIDCENLHLFQTFVALKVKQMMSLSRLRQAAKHFNSEYGYNIKLISNDQYNDTLFTELYELSNSLINEDYDHWLTHAVTNQFLHVIEDKKDNNKAVGFQFWRSIHTQSPNHSILFGGKLRYSPSIRGFGLNLLSNIEMYRHLKSEWFPNENHEIYRVGLVNIFGFVSCMDSLDKDQYFVYPFDDNKECQALIKPIMNDFCVENGFDIDKETGLVNVKQQIPQDTILSLNPSFWNKNIVNEYIGINPMWNKGWDVWVAWKLNQYNIDSMESNAWMKYSTCNIYAQDKFQ